MVSIIMLICATETPKMAGPIKRNTLRTPGSANATIKREFNPGRSPLLGIAAVIATALTMGAAVLLPAQHAPPAPFAAVQPVIIDQNNDTKAAVYVGVDWHLDQAQRCRCRSFQCKPDAALRVRR